MLRIAHIIKINNMNKEEAKNCDNNSFGNDKWTFYGEKLL